MNHIHITENGRDLATIAVGTDGQIYHEGPAAEHFIHEMNHGKTIHDGQALLDAIVQKLDPSTMIAAHHCNQTHHQSSVEIPWTDVAGVEHWEFPTNVDPAETDDVPEWGQVNPDEPKHVI